MRISGNISSLPRSIVKERSTLDAVEYSAKLEDGPIFPKPGPTLFIQVATAVKFSVNPKDGWKILRAINITI